MSVREMKSSGVEWIGDIPSSWHITKIKYAYLIISGNGFPISMQGKDTGDFPVFKASDISINHFCTARNSANYITKQESHSFKVLSKGTIIFPKIGEALKKNNRAILGVNACVDNNCQGLVPVNMHDRYSLYLLSCIDMNWFNNDGTVPCIDNSKLKNCYIPSPVKQEQTAIAYYLDSKCAEIDTLTAEIEKQIETLQEYKKSLITEAVSKGIDSSVDMKDSGVSWLGKIPKSWTIIKLKYVATMSPNVQVVTSGDVGYVPMDCVKQGYMKPNVTSIHDLPASLKAFQNNDIVLAKVTPCFENGNIAIANDLPQNIGYGSSELFTIRAKSIDTKFLFYFLQHKNFKDQCVSTMTGSGGLKRVSSYFINNCPVPLPPLKEQQSITTFLDNKIQTINSALNDKSEQLTLLAKYKQSLIYEYVTGKKTVPNA